MGNFPATAYLQIEANKEFWGTTKSMKFPLLLSPAVS